MAQGSKRSKKGLLNNPIVLIMILLLFAAVGAMQFGLLDSLFGATPEPLAPARPANISRPVAPNSAASTQASPDAKAGAPEASKDTPASAGSNTGKVDGSASQASEKSTLNAGASQPDGPAVGKGAPAQTVQAAQGPKVAESKTPASAKPRVPEFSFAVGRANPFASLAGVSATASTLAPSTTGRPVHQPQSGGSNNGAKPNGQAEAKPKEPWETWQYTGLSSYGQLRFAIIQTPTTSYIVKVGDRIEGVWLVEEITNDKIVLKGSSRTLVLVLGGDKK